MRYEVNPYVRFRGDFPRPASLSDEASGKALAELLVEGLQTRGVDSRLCEEADFQHYVECRCGQFHFELAVGIDPPAGTDDFWGITLHLPNRSWFGENPSAEDCLELLEKVNQILRSNESISAISWYPYFDLPEYLALIPTSDGPRPDGDLWDQFHPLVRFERRFDEWFLSVWILCCVAVGIVSLVDSDAIQWFTALFVGLPVVSFFVVPLLVGYLKRRAAIRLSESRGFHK